MPGRALPGLASSAATGPRRVLAAAKAPPRLALPRQATSAEPRHVTRPASPGQGRFRSCRDAPRRGLSGLAMPAPSRLAEPGHAPPGLVASRQAKPRRPRRAEPRSDGRATPCPAHAIPRLVQPRLPRPDRSRHGVSCHAHALPRRPRRGWPRTASPGCAAPGQAAPASSCRAKPSPGQVLAWSGRGPTRPAAPAPSRLAMVSPSLALPHAEPRSRQAAPRTCHAQPRRPCPRPVPAASRQDAPMASLVLAAPATPRLAASRPRLARSGLVAPGPGAPRRATPCRAHTGGCISILRRSRATRFAVVWTSAPMPSTSARS